MVSKSPLQVQTPGKGEVDDRTFSKQSGKKHQMNSNMNIFGDKIEYQFQIQFSNKRFIDYSPLRVLPEG